MVLGVATPLVSSRLVREAGPEIIGNLSIAPPGGLGAIVDERSAFLPTKEECDAPRALWHLWLLAISPLKVSGQGLGTFRE